MLFGFQSLGGVWDHSKLYTYEEKASDPRMEAENVKAIFCDSNATFSSNTVPCALSGIFFPFLDRELAQPNDLQALHSQVLQASL